VSKYPQNVPMVYLSFIDDVGVPPERAQQMIANIGAQVDHVVLPAGYLAMMTRPAELATAIRNLVGY
jgi:hypothetical protein